MIRSERSSYWDNLKGFLILLVVFAHFLYQFTENTAVSGIVNFIYAFHMPAFAFVSGYFGKSKHSQSFEGIIKLVFLYFVFNGAAALIYGIEPITEPKYSYWYLLAMIVWRLTAQYISKFKEIMLILIGISVFAGFFDGIGNIFAIARIISFYPYYMAGYLLTKEKSDSLIHSSKRTVRGLLVFAAAAAIIIFAQRFFMYSQNDLLMYSYSEPLGAFGRCVLFIIGFTSIYALRCLAPDKDLPFLTTIGRNSLWIFLFHRPVTLLSKDLLAAFPAGQQVILSVIMTVILCALLGCEPIAKLMNALADGGAEIFTPKSEKSRKKAAAGAVAGIVALGFTANIVIESYEPMFEEQNDETINGDMSDDPIFSPISREKYEEIANAFRLTFAGDLILLEDQVKRGRNGEKYDFSDVFQYAAAHISSADYAIGVFEGPMAGAKAGYSSSNFDDGKELYLNFPDEFAQNIKDAGFDLVTTANNHLLDKGEQGALRTLDILDRTGLDHTGSYRNSDEKNHSRVKLVNANGIKLAVLSYTYGINYHSTDELLNGGYSYITSIIGGTEGETFELLKAQVEEDFKDAKTHQPDLIVVLPHIGTQFSNAPDEEQEIWFSLFKQLGADIILGDHSHSVQPVKMEEYSGRTVFTLYCPGNFANIYREHQGDISALVDVYIDLNTKEVIGGGIVPLYTQSAVDGNFRALPIYEIMNDPELRAQLSTDDLERARQAHDTVTNVMLGVNIDMTNVTESYLFDESGFLRQKALGLVPDDKMKNGRLYKAIDASSSICFLGDSVTHGTKNGGVPWYEPIEEVFPDKSFANISKGGTTIKYLTDNIAAVPESDLYVIAIGTNDVRYRDDSVCAMTAEDFAARADELSGLLLQKNPSAEIAFIAPWYSTDGDKVTTLSFSEKTALNSEYSDALEKFCSEKDFIFINANGYISEKLLTAPDKEYLLDHIHPNASKGVIMYSEAVLSCG